MPDDTTSTLEAPSEPTETTELACRATDLPDELLMSLRGQAAGGPAEYRPFRCLRFVDEGSLAASSSPLTVIDVRQGAAKRHRGELSMPLHVIKTKSFLRDRDIALRSDGNNFAMIERACEDMTSAGIGKVYALLTHSATLSASATQPLGNAKLISPKDYLAERRFGAWRIVNLGQGELDASIFEIAGAPSVDSQQGGRKSAALSLQRTLFVFDDETGFPTNEQINHHASAGPVFVLEGGAAGLSQYQAESQAMLVAAAMPRISERGCTSR